MILASTRVGTGRPELIMGANGTQKRRQFRRDRTRRLCHLQLGQFVDRGAFSMYRSSISLLEGKRYTASTATRWVSSAQSCSLPASPAPPVIQGIRRVQRDRRSWELRARLFRLTVGRNVFRLDALAGAGPGDTAGGQRGEVCQGGVVVKRQPEGDRQLAGGFDLHRE